MEKFEYGAAIRRERERRGISSREIARRLGISTARMSRLETGIRSPHVRVAASLDLCERIAAAIGCKPAALLPKDLVKQMRRIVGG